MCPFVHYIPLIAMMAAVMPCIRPLIAAMSEIVVYPTMKMLSMYSNIIDIHRIACITLQNITDQLFQPIFLRISPKSYRLIQTTHTSLNPRGPPCKLIHTALRLRVRLGAFCGARNACEALTACLIATNHHRGLRGAAGRARLRRPTRWA